MNRLYWLDLLRSIFLFFMIIYHFYWDLIYFHYINNSAFANLLWTKFAHLTAIGFLTIVGFSLTLSFELGNKSTFNKRFFTRLLKIATSALAISIVTYIIFPENYIFFGILHQILISSLLLFFLLRFNILISILFVLFFLLYNYKNVYSSYFLWLGLSPITTSSLDFVPIFPWTAWTIIGSIIGKFYIKYKIIWNMKPNNFISWFSKKSLFIYLIHQPILFGLVFIFNFYSLEPTFIANCQQICVKNKYPYNYCKKYCSCMDKNLSIKNFKNAVNYCK